MRHARHALHASPDSEGEPEEEPSRHKRPKLHPLPAPGAVQSSEDGSGAASSDSESGDDSADSDREPGVCETACRQLGSGML
jgi:hypothetical protein